MDVAAFCPSPNNNPSNSTTGAFYTRITAENTPPEFQLSDYLMLQDWLFEQHDQNMATANKSSSENMSSSSTLFQSDDRPPSRPPNIKCRSGSMKRNIMDEGLKIAFRTKSKLDIMDDGFKWRKYGKKMVKNSPNPRNYFKCSSGGCNVKKRVERDREDSRFVITTYDGVHNHETPCVVYYTSHVPSTIPNGWNLQDSFSRDL